MTEPQRLHMEPESELERSLLDAGRSYTASSSTRAKALAGLGIVAVTASSTTAASAVTKAGITKWIAATALLAGAAMPAVHYLRLRAAVPPSANTVSPSAPSTAGRALAEPTQAPPASSLPAPSEPADLGANPTPTSAPGPVHAEAKSAAPAALAAELSALDAARSALANGDANGALSGLDAYSRNFPRGKLALEAEVLRIDALAKSGQAMAAKRHAEAFMKRHPDSVLASRVRAYAGQ